MDSKEEKNPIRELIKLIKGTIALLKQNKGVFGLCIALGIAFGVYLKVTSISSYSAKTTYMMQTNSGSSMSALAGLASQFGLGGSSSALNEDKLISIANSKLIIGKTLLTTANVNGKKDLLVNHFLESKCKVYGCSKDPMLFKSSDRSTFTVEQDSILKKISSNLVGERMVFKKNKSGLITISLKFVDEEFTVEYLKQFTNCLMGYFENQSVEKEKKSLVIVQAKADSILSTLLIKERQLAALKDSKVRTVKAKGLMEELDLEREVRILNTLYAETVKNLEMVKFDLMYNTPVINIVDEPRLPLVENRRGLKSSLILGGILGTILGLVLIFFKDAYKKYWK